LKCSAAFVHFSLAAADSPDSYSFLALAGALRLTIETEDPSPGPFAQRDQRTVMHISGEFAIAGQQDGEVTTRTAGRNS